MIKWLPIGLLVSGLAWADLPKTGNNKFSVTIEKSCEGHSLEDAKQACFESAIEHVVGQVVLSDRVAENNEITKYDVAQYSAGYINDYRILKQEQDQAGWYHLTMSMDVASSKIAQRMLDGGIDSNGVLGEKLQAQIATEKKRRQDGDRLLAQVLDSFPYNAFKIDILGVGAGHGNYRDPKLYVSYSLSLNPKWLEAFNEALGLVAVDSHSCSSITKSVTRAIKVKNNGPVMTDMVNSYCGHDPDITIIQDGWISRESSYSFPDIKTMEMINKVIGTELGKNVVGVRVDIEANDGSLLDTKCANIPIESFIRFESNRMRVVNLNQKLLHIRPVLSSKNTVHGAITVDLDGGYDLQRASNVELTVQSECF